MVKTGFDITNNYIRARQHDPGMFEKDSIRTIRLTSGIKAVVGRKKGEKTTTIQSVLFDKNKFDEKSAYDWLMKHNSKFSDALNLESQKVSLFEDAPQDQIAELDARISAIEDILQSMIPEEPESSMMVNKYGVIQ